MNRRGFHCTLLLVLALLAPAAAQAATYSNPTPIAIPAPGSLNNQGPSAPYPSTISVSDQPGTVIKARVSLSGVSHTFPADIDTLLVGPGGRETILASNVCANNPLTGQTLTFDDAASAPLPQNGFCSSGTYKPTKAPGFDPTFTSPAPTGPQTVVALSALNGGPANGTWQLFVFDNGMGDTGLISGGWNLQLQASGRCAGKATTMTGTTGPDQLTGTPGADVIAGLGGKDSIRGLGGKDVICGDESRDTLIGGPGNDLLLGGQGHDRLLGGKGKDTCKGGGGALDRAKSCEKQRSI